MGRRQKKGRAPPRHTAPGGQAVRSATSASGAWVFTEAIPFSQAALPEYIWLLPMVWPLLALRLKYGLPSLAVRRSKLPSSWLWRRTESMPLTAEALAL